MLPSIDLRIENVIKALEQVILPALPTQQRLARDQIRLCVGHLRMIGEQWQWAGAFEVGSLDAMIGLGDVLVVSGDETYCEALAIELAHARDADRGDQGAVTSAIRTLGAVIDRIILGDDGRILLSADARSAILDYGDRQARRERAWFAMNALDPDRHELPDIGAMMAGLGR